MDFAGIRAHCAKSLGMPGAASEKQDEERKKQSEKLMEKRSEKLSEN